MKLERKCGRLWARILEMDRGDADVSRGQLGGLRRIECGQDNAFLLHGFGIVEGRNFESIVSTAFDACDADLIALSMEFKLVGGQRRVRRVDININRRKTNLLRRETHREEQEDEQDAFHNFTASAAIAPTSF